MPFCHVHNSKCVLLTQTLLLYALHGIGQFVNFYLLSFLTPVFVQQVHNFSLHHISTETSAGNCRCVTEPSDKHCGHRQVRLSRMRTKANVLSEQYKAARVATVT